MEPLEIQIPPSIAHFLDEGRSPRTDEEIDLFMTTIVRHYQRPDTGAGLIGGGGTDAVTHYTDIKRVIAEMHRLEPFLKSSAFVDFGSGSGFFAIYVALKHRIPCYGVESQPQSVEIARHYARWAFLQNLYLDPGKPGEWGAQDSRWFREHGPVALFENSYFEVLAKDWIRQRGITHLWSYDAVYDADGLNAIRRLVKGEYLLGASSKKKASFLPRSAVELAKLPAVKVGHSSFTFIIWRNDPGRSSSSSSEEEGEPDKRTHKASWVIWYISRDPDLLAKAEEGYGAEWRAEVGTLLAKNSFNVEATLVSLRELKTRGKRRGPDRHAMLPIVTKV
jgi:hypothetical protein